VNTVNETNYMAKDMDSCQKDNLIRAIQRMCSGTYWALDGSSTKKAYEFFALTVGPDPCLT
jgi:hypothetical protein